MKNKILAMVLIMFSFNSFAGGICMPNAEGQSEENKQQTESELQSLAGTQTPMLLVTCAITLLKGMSPKDIFDLECDDGSHPCKEALKSTCKTNKYGIWIPSYCAAFSGVL